jgi:hypothetical protein
MFARVRDLARRRVRIPLGDDVYEPSTAWHVAALVVVAGAAGLVEGTLVLELASGSPSSTAPLIVPFMAFYAGAALVGLAVVDLAVRWALGRVRGPSAG